MQKKGKMMNEKVNAIIRQIVDYEVAEQMAAKTAEIDKQVAEQMAAKSAEMEKHIAAEMEERMAKKESDYQAELAKDQAEIARLKAALQEALSKVPQ